MSSDLKRFLPNLSTSRPRKSSFDSRPRVDSVSSDDPSLFSLKNQDFALAPSLSPQKRFSTSRLPPSSSKNSDIHFAPDMVCEEVGMEDDDFIHLARSIAEQNGGTCLSETCEAENFPLTYKCKLGHVWESNAVLLQGDWCWRCSNLLRRARAFAEAFGGRCLSSACDLLLEFQCKQGHGWRADVTRYQYQKWCKQCAVDERAAHKQKVLTEMQAEEEEQVRAQEKLFKEARDKMQRSKEVEVVENEREVERIAEEMARRYVEERGEELREQLVWVYMVVCASEALVKKKYFGEGNKDQATANYRKLARCLHPDKNRHPFAAEAFLKVSSIYAAVIASA